MNFVQKSQQNNLLQNSGARYYPSEIEKKRVITLYLGIGVLIFLTKKEISLFEYYYLKKTIGFWLIMGVGIIAFILGWILYLFRPIVVIGFLGLIGWWIYEIYYIYTMRQISLEKLNRKDKSLLVGIGEWLLNIFDYNPKIKI